MKRCFKFYGSTDIRLCGDIANIGLYELSMTTGGVSGLATASGTASVTGLEHKKIDQMTIFASWSCPRDRSRSCESIRHSKPLLTYDSDLYTSDPNTLTTLARLKRMVPLIQVPASIPLQIDAPPQ